MAATHRASEANLANVVRFWAAWNPGGRSIVTDAATLSWAELHDRTNRLARGLHDAGIRRGDRIGILSGNCVEYLEMAVAGYKLGSILVPLNVRLAAPELRFIVGHAGCSAVVADGDLAGLAAAALDGTDVLRIGMRDGFGRTLDSMRADDATDPVLDVGDDGATDPVVGADDIAYICYTSGTTGLPKGAMLSHGNVLAMSTNRILADDLTSRSRVYLPFPLSFTGGLVSVWAPTYVGGATLVLDAAVDPVRAMQVIEAEHVTNFSAVPVIWEMLVNHPDFGAYDLSSLAVIGSGGASVPKVLLERLQAAGLPMSQGYGLTEGCGMNSWLNAADATRKVGSCGRPLMHTRMRTVDEAGVDVLPGEVGELLIKGPEVMVGYWNDPDATAATLVDGWLHTGDLARIDDEGYVFIVDRAKDMLISGGLNVYPAEVERVIAAFPGVAEVAVIGVRDEKWGETAAALIGPRPGAVIDPAAVLEHCRAELADYKLPRYVVVRDQPLPRGMSGKVLKRDLRDEYADLDRSGMRLR